MKKNYCIIALCFTVSCFSQKEVKTELQPSERLIKFFSELVYWENIDINVSKELLYQNSDFSVAISENLINFNVESTVLENPYYSIDEDDEYENDYINYPVSFSVIHDDNLVSLFDNGKFVVHDIEKEQRNTELESLLNTKKFKYHWLIDNKLCALSNNKIYEWYNGKWVKLSTNFPLRKQPVLFEDDDFIVFRDCLGEWGGTIYFFHKSSGEIYITESTCTNTVIKEGKQYKVLSNLGHLQESTKLKIIENPLKLTKINKREIDKKYNGHARYTDLSGEYEEESLFGIQLLSLFDYEQKQLFIAHIKELTFIAEIKGSKIEIVHPLFDNKLYMNEPITSSYGKHTLININDYWRTVEREVSVIIIKDNIIKKYDWNEVHD